MLYVISTSVHPVKIQFCKPPSLFMLHRKLHSALSLVYFLILNKASYTAEKKNQSFLMILHAWSWCQIPDAWCQGSYFQAISEKKFVLYSASSSWALFYCACSQYVVMYRDSITCVFLYRDSCPCVMFYSVSSPCVVLYSAKTLFLLLYNTNILWSFVECQQPIVIVL